MKKKILAYLLVPVLAAVLWSCDKSTEGLTRITYYPTLEILGEQTVIVNVGETYTDEGCYAELNGEDVSSEVQTSSNVDYNTPGVYSISYIIYNADGFSTTASRTVYVLNPDDIATLYWGECVTPSETYTGAMINISDNGDGTYRLDDIMGGFYFNGVYPGYEPNYDFHAEVDFQLNADNTITQVGEVGDWYFSDQVTMSILEGSYDPLTHTVTLSVEYNTSTLAVTLVAITKDDF